MSHRERVAALAIAARLLGCACPAGCAGAGTPRSPTSAQAPDESPGVPPPTNATNLAGELREKGLRALDDPSESAALILPGSLEGAHRWGTEPGGGVRAVVSGVRVVSWRDGVLVGAADRLPASPSIAVELPERLGGGFALAIGPRLWRSETWLGPAGPIFTSQFPISDVFVGLDRLYVRSPQGFIAALDPRTGASLGLGPIPASPRIARLASLDAWHQIVLADLRGALVTFDAGSSWHPVPIPIEPSDVGISGAMFSVRGLDQNRSFQSWQVSPEGEASWLAPAAARAPAGPPDPAAASPDPLPRIFGPQPLVAALEDGWPLADGTALVARDGAIARIRLSDGALVEAVADAFPLKPARCHAISLASLERAGEKGAFGFVCGEPRGGSAVYEWNALRSRLTELRRFDGPREILGFGNGALAARGACSGPGSRGVSAEDAEDDADQPWCIKAPGADWSEIRLRGEGVARARLVVLSDGRSILVRPPAGGDLSTARLTITDGKQANHLLLKLPTLRPEIVRALRWGVWMDGFEERRPGVVGGWVDAGGSIIGIEVALNGEVRVGEFVRDAGSPIASGRWALGWTASGAGFQTTDGGMTWAREIELPGPIAEGDRARERVCGPVGCILAGWLRVGWGLRPATPVRDPPPARPLWVKRPSPGLTFDCDLLAAKPPEGTPPVRPTTGRDAVVPFSLGPRVGGLSSSANWGTVSEFPPFAGRPGPSIPGDERGLPVEVSAALEHAFRSQLLARIYAWGPGTGDWAPGGRWQVRWQSPWGGWTDARSSAVSPTPWPGLDAARRALATAQPGAWALATADDFDHALLVAQDTGASAGSGTSVIVLESDRAPVEARPAGGEPFPAFEAAVHSAGHWYVATFQRPSEPAATILWSLDGAVARELGRVPRLGFTVRPPLRLARRGDGRTLGLVLDGQPEFDRGAALWVTSFDVETGAVGEPEKLAPADLSDRTAPLCTGDDSGWELEIPYPGEVEVHVGRPRRPEGRTAGSAEGGDWNSTLQAPMARMRILPDRACVDRISGSAGAYASAAPAAFLSRSLEPSTGSSAHVRTVDVSVLSARTRFPLRCHEP